MYTRLLILTCLQISQIFFLLQHVGLETQFSCALALFIFSVPRAAETTCQVLGWMGDTHG